MDFSLAWDGSLGGIAFLLGSWVIFHPRISQPVGLPATDEGSAPPELEAPAT